MVNIIRNDYAEEVLDEENMNVSDIETFDDTNIPLDYNKN